MTRVTWDGAIRPYSQGVSSAVLYTRNSPGVPWNGLISVTEKGDDSSTSLSVDGQTVRNSITPSTFAGTISAFMYPDELEQYIGVNKGVTGQPKKSFGLTYRDNNEIHLVYNILVGSSSDKYQTLGGDTNPVAFSWDFTTLPEKIPGGRPSAHLVIMVDHAPAAAVSALEDIIYGDDANDSSLPDPTTVYQLFDAHAFLQIVDNGDGSWTATDNLGTILTMLDGETFQINWSSAVVINADEYTIRSL